MLEDKKPALTVFHGDKDKQGARVDLEKLNDTMGFRTAYQTLPDGGYRITRTKGGMPQVTTVKGSSSVEPLKYRGFVAAAPGAVQGYLFDPTEPALPKIKDKYGPAGHGFAVAQLVSPINATAKSFYQNEYKWNDVWSSYGGYVWVNGQKQVQLGAMPPDADDITGEYRYVPHIHTNTLGGKNTYSRTGDAAVKARVYAVSRIGVIDSMNNVSVELPEPEFRMMDTAKVGGIQYIGSDEIVLSYQRPSAYGYDSPIGMWEIDFTTATVPRVGSLSKADTYVYMEVPSVAMTPLPLVYSSSSGSVGVPACQCLQIGTWHFYPANAGHPRCTAEIINERVDSVPADGVKATSTISRKFGGDNATSAALPSGETISVAATNTTEYRGHGYSISVTVPSASWTPITSTVFNCNVHMYDSGPTFVGPYGGAEEKWETVRTTWPDWPDGYATNYVGISGGSDSEAEDEFIANLDVTVGGDTLILIQSRRYRSYGNHIEATANSIGVSNPSFSLTNAMEVNFYTHTSYGSTGGITTAELLAIRDAAFALANGYFGQNAGVIDQARPAAVDPSSLYTFTRTAYDNTTLEFTASTKDIIVDDPSSGLRIWIEGEFARASDSSISLDCNLKIERTGFPSATKSLLSTTFAVSALLPLVEFDPIHHYFYVPVPKMGIHHCPAIRSQGDFPGYASTTLLEEANGAEPHTLLNMQLELCGLDNYGSQATGNKIKFCPGNLLEVLHAYIFSMEYGLLPTSRYPILNMVAYRAVKNSLLKTWLIQYQDGILTDWTQALGAPYNANTTTEVSRA